MPLPPGPGAPAALQTLQWVRDPERFLRRARERYGPTFTAQLGPRTNVVFVSDPASVREVFHGRSEEMNMGDINGLFRCIMGRTGLLVIDGEDHLRRRKLMLPPFRAARLSEHVPSMLAAASEHVDGWKAGDEFAVSPQMQAITLDVILRAVFGLTPGPRRDYLRELLSTMLNLVDQPAITLPQLRKRLGGLGRWAKLLRCLDEVDAALYEEIARRRETGPRGESDVLSLLLADGTLDDVELRDQLLTMLVGGHETTATALAWCFERLVRHPEAMARCVAEVDAGVSHEYVDACIKESLRLRPVLPIAARKVTVPFTVGGREYAPGTVLMVCMYLLHRDPEIYPDPEAFRPERWLDGGPPPYAFVPFGGGVRRCLGAGFASAEMRAVVQTVLRRVTLEAVEAGGERMIRRSFTLAPSAGGTVRVSGLRPAPRSPAAELATAAEPAKATA